MNKKYSKILRTPTFIAAYSEMRVYLKRSSPLAFLALPLAMTTILDTISSNPRAWPIKRKRIDGMEYEFHVAIIDIAYRQLHIRYFVDFQDTAYLSAAWVDGNDEPGYVLP